MNIKDCGNCKHAKSGTYEEPCLSCREYNKFEIYIGENSVNRIKKGEARKSIKPFSNGYMLKIEVDNDFKNDLLFKFDDAIEMMNFVRTFRKTCNTVCEYNIGIEEEDDDEEVLK